MGNINPGGIIYRKPGKFFSEKFLESGKYQVNMCHSYLMEHSVSRKQPGSQKNRIPPRIKTRLEYQFF